MNERYELLCYLWKRANSAIEFYNRLPGDTRDERDFANTFLELSTQCCTAINVIYSM